MRNVLLLLVFRSNHLIGIIGVNVVLHFDCIYCSLCKHDIESGRLNWGTTPINHVGKNTSRSGEGAVTFVEDRNIIHIYSVEWLNSNIFISLFPT